MMPRVMSEAERELASELSNVLARGGHRAGVLLVSREPLPGFEGASTRVLTSVCMREADLATAVDLIHLAKRLRQVADEIDAMMRQRGGGG